MQLSVNPWVFAAPIQKDVSLGMPAIPGGSCCSLLIECDRYIAFKKSLKPQKKKKNSKIHMNNNLFICKHSLSHFQRCLLFHCILLLQPTHEIDQSSAILLIYKSAKMLALILQFWKKGGRKSWKKEERGTIIVVMSTSCLLLIFRSTLQVFLLSYFTYEETQTQRS